MFGFRKRTWENDYDEYYGRRAPREPRERSGTWIHLAFLTVFGCIIFGAIWAIAGYATMEKSGKALLTPVGLVWCVLLLQTYFGFVCRRPAIALTGLASTVLLTAGGNLFVQRWLVDSLERPYAQVDVRQMPKFDVLVVLGGATGMTPAGMAQVGGAGDRLVTAARMYHRGQADLLVVTGESIWKAAEHDLEPAEASRLILLDLGVPDDKLVMLKGRNTSEEMDSIRGWLEANDRQQQRVGLITSAWHLQRAATLAAQRGVNVEPVPSNILSSPFAPNPSIVIPSADNLDSTTRILHEYLGRWLGR